jgi:hypothetical protein
MMEAEYGIHGIAWARSTSLAGSLSRCLAVSPSRRLAGPCRLVPSCTGRLEAACMWAAPNGGTLGIWSAAVGSILRGARSRMPNDASTAANHMAGFPSAMSGCRAELSSRLAPHHPPGRYAGRRSQQHSAFQPTAAAFTQQSPLRPVGARTASTRWGPPRLSRHGRRRGRRRHGRRHGRRQLCTATAMHGDSLDDPLRNGRRS